MAENQTLIKSEQALSVDTAAFSAFGSLQHFTDAQRMATALSSSTIVPETYRGPQNLGNCLIALEIANRIGANVLAVMQNLYIVYGRPAWSSQFLISCVNASGRFSPIRYRITGEKNTDTWGCIAWATDKSGERLESPEITIATAKAEGWYQKNGSKWRTMPELMLRYRTATLFARLYAPELTMGIQTDEEVIDVEVVDTAPVVTEPRVKQPVLPPGPVPALPTPKVSQVPPKPVARIPIPQEAQPPAKPAVSMPRTPEDELEGMNTPPDDSESLNGGAVEGQVEQSEPAEHPYLVQLRNLMADAGILEASLFEWMRDKKMQIVKTEQVLADFYTKDAQGNDRSSAIGKIINAWAKPNGVVASMKKWTAEKKVKQ